MSIDPRAAAEAVAVKETVTLRELSDGPGIGFTKDAQEALEPLRLVVEGEIDREEVDVTLTVLEDGETLLDIQANGKNGNGRNGH